MKLLVLLALLWLVKAETATNQEIKPKPTMQTLNSVTVSQKPEYYQPPPQHQYQQPQYVQVIPKPVYQPHMIIIAQPAYLPPNLVYNNPTQQLLNYFHSNPQARYQLLHGYQPQPHYVHQNSLVSASPSIGHYQYVAAPPQYQTAPPQYQTAPAQYQAPHGNQLSFAHSAPYQQQVQQSPGQLGQIAHLAQLAAQQYVHNPARSTPAIITGLENFTPDQQAKIKAQLSAHFGNPLQPLTSQSTGTPSSKQELRYVASPAYPVRYQQPLTQSSGEFVPSQQIKSETSAAGGSESLKSQQYQKM